MSTESTGPARAGSSSQGIRRELKDATRGTEIMGLFKERGFVGDDESADSLLQHIARRRRLAIIPLQGSREDRRVRRGKPGARVLRHCYDEAGYARFTYAVCSVLFPGLLEVGKMATFLLY